MSAKNKKETVPGYRLHKPSGRAVVTLNGRDHYLGKFDSDDSRDAYRTLVATWLANGRRLPLAGVARSVSVAEVCDDFLSWCEREYRDQDGVVARSVENVRIALRPLVHGRFAAIPAVDFGPRALVEFREELVAAGLVRRTINERVGTVKRAFRHATREERIPPSVFQSLQSVEGLRRGRGGAREPEGVTPVPDEHVERALPFMPPTVRAMVELQLLTGCRPGEVVVVRPCDIDRSGSVWLLRPARHKNSWRGHERVIALGERAQAVIRPFLRPGCLDLPLFSPAESERVRWQVLRSNRATPLWPSHVRAQERQRAGRDRRKLNEEYSVASYRRAIARACRKAGVPKWSPGRLRHNAATRIRRERGVEAAAAVLGHRQVETTQIYADTQLALAMDVAAKIG
ncbi:MAG: site-specific integrase [bacterium]|nr:site-specific integrase [bacterium]